MRVLGTPPNVYEMEGLDEVSGQKAFLSHRIMDNLLEAGTPLLRKTHPRTGFYTPFPRALDAGPGAGWVPAGPDSHSGTASPAPRETVLARGGKHRT